MKKEETNKIIHIDVFSRDLMVHFGDKESLKKALKPFLTKKVIKYVLDEIDFSGCGYTLYNSKKGVFLVWMPGKPSTPDEFKFLVHELLHATVATMEAIGVEPSESSEESYAYLIGYLTGEVIKEFSLTLTSPCHVQRRSCWDAFWHIPT